MEKYFLKLLDIVVLLNESDLFRVLRTEDF